MARKNVLEERWQEIKAAVKKRFGDKITDAELDQVAGQHDQLCHLIGDKCGLSEHQSRREVQTIMDELAMRSTNP
jgi:uncharacterized protein YjbJ (UPF0337 family)